MSYYFDAKGIVNAEDVHASPIFDILERSQNAQVEAAYSCHWHSANSNYYLSCSLRREHIEGLFSILQEIAALTAADGEGGVCYPEGRLWLQGEDREEAIWAVQDGKMWLLAIDADWVALTDVRDGIPTTWGK